MRNKKTDLLRAIEKAMRENAKRMESATLANLGVEKYQTIRRHLVAANWALCES